MVVGDFDTVGAFVPDEADAPLVVYADAVLSFAVPRQFFEAVAWGDAQVVDVPSGVDELHLDPGLFGELVAEPLDEVEVEDRFGVAVLERVDHVTNTNASRY